MAVVLLISIILIDQVSKIIVKTNMSLHECIDIFSWFKIVFMMPAAEVSSARR